MVSSSISDPIPVLTPELFDRLKERVENTLLQLIKKNRRTRYLHESPVFCDFCSVLDTIGDAVNEESLVEAFRATVPLIGYDSYQPFVNQLVTLNPREKDVRDMFSPRLPNFIASSSATSSKKAKLFAKYHHPSGSLRRHLISLDHDQVYDRWHSVTRTSHRLPTSSSTKLTNEA